MNAGQSSDNLAAIFAAIGFSCRDIYRAMQFLAKRCEPHQQYSNACPVLACVLIEPDHGGAKLTVTDLESRHSVIIPAHWEVPGAMAVEARAMNAVQALAARVERVEATARAGNHAVAA